MSWRAIRHAAVETRILEQMKCLKDSDTKLPLRPIVKSRFPKCHNDLSWFQGILRLVSRHFKTGGSFQFFLVDTPSVMSHPALASQLVIQETEGLHESFDESISWLAGHEGPSINMTPPQNA